jgi:hypothetical protein
MSSGILVDELLNLGFKKTGSCLLQEKYNDIDLVYPGFFTDDLMTKLALTGFVYSECRIPWVPKSWRRLTYDGIDVFEMDPVYYIEYDRVFSHLHSVKDNPLSIIKDCRSAYVNNQMTIFITNKLSELL